LSEVIAFDLDALLAQLSEHRRKADERGINFSAADAGGAAHRRIINLDGFHFVLHVHQLVKPVTFAIVMLMQSDFIITREQRLARVFRRLLDAIAGKIDKNF